jgi:hypothetical protein
METSENPLDRAAQRNAGVRGKFLFRAPYFFPKMSVSKIFFRTYPKKRVQKGVMNGKEKQNMGWG